MSLNGIISFHKPAGITSAQTLYRVRTITGQRKSGHAGTLDRLADGVLVLCLGRATKLVESVMDQPKVYRASARLDVTSQSFDSGEPYEHVDHRQEPSRTEVEEALTSFEGAIEQTPPLISAVKVDGVPAHRRTRRNQEIELRPKLVRIYWIRLHRYEWPCMTFEVCCSRGTYIRALIRDLGHRLGTGGCLTSLTRTCVGPFVLDDATDFEAMERADDATEFLTDLDEARHWLDPRNINIPSAPDSDVHSLDGKEVAPGFLDNHCIRSTNGTQFVADPGEMPDRQTD